MDESGQSATDTLGSDPAQSDPAQSEPVQPGARKAGKVIGRSLLAVASVAVLAATALGWVTLDKLQGGVSKSNVLAEIPGPPPADDGATDILLVGNDSRTDAQGNPLPLSVLKSLRTESTNSLNTDTMILVRIPKSGGPVTAVSIPRDVSTAVPGPRPEKINAVYGLAKSERTHELRSVGSTDARQIERESNVAGQRALAQSVQALTGVRIDHYAEVNLLGFYEITKAIGGVEVCLNQATTDEDSGADFHAGRQMISGGDALSFVRQRHGLPRGDLDRIVRQQVFMAAVADKVLSTGTLTDPDKMRGLSVAAQRAVVLDEGWDIVGFAQQMQGLTTGGVRFLTVPVTGTGRDDRGQSIVTFNPAQVKKFIADLSAPTPPAPPTRLAGSHLVRLDGKVSQRPPQAEPEITSGGVRCVN